MNFRWVLSAGHCFCTKTPCKDDGSGNLVVDYVPKDRVACVVGLNDIALLPRLDERMKDMLSNPSPIKRLYEHILKETLLNTTIRCKFSFNLVMG